MQPAMPCCCVSGDEDSIQSGRFSNHKIRADALEKVCLFLLSLKRPGSMRLSHLSQLTGCGGEGEALFLCMCTHNLCFLIFRMDVILLIPCVNYFKICA